MLRSSQLLRNCRGIKKRPDFFDFAVAELVEDMFCEMNHLAGRLKPKKLRFRCAVKPDTRGDTVVDDQQRFQVEAEIWGGGEAGIDHGCVLGDRHEPPVVRNLFVDERDEGGVRVYGSNVGSVACGQGRVRHDV